MPARIDFEFRFNLPQRQRVFRSDEDRPMHILLMGDFSGRGSREDLEQGADLANRSIRSVDIDSFAELMERLEPRLFLPLAGSPEEGIIEFRELGDFHPDVLYQRLKVFQPLRQWRERLADPVTFAQAAAELRHGTGTTISSAHQAEPIPAEDDAATIGRLLGRRPADRPRTLPAGQRAGLIELIKGIVAPHIVPGVDPQQPLYLASVDEAISIEMQAVLHHPAVQALEAALRSVHWLVTGLETGEALKLYLLDVTKQELAADIRGVGTELQASGLYRLLVEKGRGAPDSEPWSLLVGNYTFGTSLEDITLLAALGAIASQAGGPFIAAAASQVLGCPSLAETPDPLDWKPQEPKSEQRWQALQHSTMASWIGLALPRLLLRLPYSKRTDPVESFAFEELLSHRDHEHYLWGNPAFACALLIARSFLERGWSMPLGDSLEIDDLPAYSYSEEGETKLKPCAEVLLSERAAEVMLNRGVMPFLSYKNRNAVRLARFQSLADPLAELVGPMEGIKVLSGDHRRLDPFRAATTSPATG